jgi:enoyl-CoA hydratase/carnithine racemase
MDEPLVIIEVADGVATLTLNRVQARNALSPALIESLNAALQQVGGDRTVRVVVVTGAGDKAFCAGGDLGGQRGDGGFAGMHADRGAFVELLQTMFGLGKPIIAKVQGLALGGGLGLVLACDLAVASETATFGTPEIKVGLFPMMIMTLIFRNIGRKRAMEMMLTGERLDAREALQIGMLNSVVPAGELDAAVDELAQRVAGHSPAVLKLGRDAVYHTMDMPIMDGLRHLHGQLTINTMLEDAAEGVSAFLGKRPPVWKGR